MPRRKLHPGSCCGLSYRDSCIATLFLLLVSGVAVLLHFRSTAQNAVDVTLVGKSAAHAGVLSGVSGRTGSAPSSALSPREDTDAVSPLAVASLEAEANKPSSLSSSIEVEAPSSQNGKSLVLYSVDNRLPDTIMLSGVSVFTDRRSVRFVNAGSGMKWEGDKSKTVMMHRWLQAQPNKKQVVMFSETDVISGGCSTDELRRRYETVKAASGGATLVIGAAFGAYPKKQGERLFKESREREIQQLRYFDLSPDWSAKHLRDRKRLCLDSGTYSCLSYGFVMGPVGQMEQMVKFVLDNTKWLSREMELDPREKFKVWTEDNVDQFAAMEYMLQHPGEVTLDYAGRLFLSLNHFGYDRKLFSDFVQFEDRGSAGFFTLPALGNTTTTCFLHFDGHSKLARGEMMARLKAVVRQRTRRGHRHVLCPRFTSC
eukprot:TRINITY_DN16214_c0_g1_i4.p1 TRINITY_DN16214_c0_g1~~TRINITY_DN16214_c0_g1_i4.p1  ORF type:complete len:428 (-),score=26.98 TRINITY_DN16214_c0_g1_i4:96-1379(-)